MRRLLITTVVRRAELHESSGYIRVLDLERMALTGCAPIREAPWRDRDPNPRGGLRGGRGVCLGDDATFIANNSAVFRYDQAWRQTGAFIHPACASIHDIVWREGTLWATSSFNDLLFAFEKDGRVRRIINLRDFGAFLRHLEWNEPNLIDTERALSGDLNFRDPRNFDEKQYDGFHVNSLCFLPEGDMLVSLGLLHSAAMKRLGNVKEWLLKHGLWRPVVTANQMLMRTLHLKKLMNSEVAFQLATSCSVVLRLHTTGEPATALVLTQANSPGHSLAPLEDGTVLYCNTSAGEIVQYDPGLDEMVARFKVTDEYLRGACALADGRVAVGAQHDVLFVDLKNRDVVGSVSLSEDPRESVYAIMELPSHFAPLPATLEAEELGAAPDLFGPGRDG